jgi:hypothetical protein
MMTKKRKNINQMKLDELEAVFKEFDIPLPDDEKYTRSSLIDDLATYYNITNETLKALDNKEDTELTVDDKDGYTEFAEDPETGKQVICMDRNNISYQVGVYYFSKTHRYVAVDAETASFLLNEETGFHKATREEIQRNFK